MPPLEDENDFLFDPKKVPADQRALGRFRLLHELGTGGMATLFLAMDEMGRLMAVKRLHPHLAAERRFVDMFTDEAAIAARISHPNVCQVHGLEQAQGQLFIAMEYVHGESLKALLQQAARSMGHLPLEMAAHLVSQACLGLHAAHELADRDDQPLKVVHRDVSPQNLIISYDGELKVVDFGIAAAVSKLHHTEAGTIKGKFSYMSPEQARGAETVDCRADIYALGVVLYEAVCNTSCFGGSNAAEVVRRVQEGKYRPPAQCRPHLPAALGLIIERALALQPDDRYASAAEMYRDLYGFLASSRGMTTRAIGDLMRRLFAQRYALREEMLSLAFSAPKVLEEEEISVETTASLTGVHRCDYCGKEFTSEAGLQTHLQSCPQRQWWEKNFGGHRQIEGIGDVSLMRKHLVPKEQEQRKGIWQRFRSRLGNKTPKDPLVLRLRNIEERFDTVRDLKASQLADRSMTALWGMIGEIREKNPQADDLLADLKPKLVHCANLMLGITLELEGNAAYLVTCSDFQVQTELENLMVRLDAARSKEMAEEIESTIRRKRGLIAERQRLAHRNELLLLRLESMVDAVELTYTKVLQIAASPAIAHAEATTQITVFLDSMLIEVEQLVQSVREMEDDGKIR